MRGCIVSIRFDEEHFSDVCIMEVIFLFLAQTHVKLIFNFVLMLHQKKTEFHKPINLTAFVKEHITI